MTSVNKSLSLKCTTLPTRLGSLTDTLNESKNSNLGVWERYNAQNTDYGKMHGAYVVSKCGTHAEHGQTAWPGQSAWV